MSVTKRVLDARSSSCTECEEILGMPAKQARKLLDKLSDVYPGAKAAIEAARMVRHKKQKKITSEDVAEEAAVKAYELEEKLRPIRRDLREGCYGSELNGCAEQLRRLLQDIRVMAIADTADALRAMVTVGTELKKEETRSRFSFKSLMHRYPLSDYTCHNVGRDFRDALRDVAGGCSSDMLAAVLGTNLEEARSMAREALLDAADDNDDDEDYTPNTTEVRKKTRELLREKLEEKFCFRRCDGFDPDDEDSAEDSFS